MATRELGRSLGDHPGRPRLQALPGGEDAGHKDMTGEAGGAGEDPLRAGLRAIAEAEDAAADKEAPGHAEAARQPSRARALWATAWPKLAAVGLAIAAWELVVLSGWRPEYVLPGPGAVLGRLWADLLSGDVAVAAAITMKRALLGYAIALVVGVVVGLVLARVKVLRTAAGSLLTGLQTMPSVAWFPLAILLFQLSEAAILAVVVLGAAPSIAIGLLTSTDQVPPLLVRAGRVMGARGLSLYRHIIIPAALPGFVAGLKQGWAFAWRSLMAGELLVIIGHAPSIGVRLQFSRELSDAEGLLAWMLVVMLLGVLVDGLVFGALERRIREGRGLTAEHA